MNNQIFRRAEQVFPTPEGLKNLLTKRKIRLYQGFDPSAPNLHIGHLVGLLQLKSFQNAGHEVIFLIGDFTGMIGDPTDKTATRKKLTREQVLENAKTYQEQAGRILRFDGDNAAKIMFNSEWLEKLNFAEILELASNLTVQQLIERDMFKIRLKEQKPIHLHEFLYPLLQGYDSVAMDVDLEVGGRDQLFNMMTGRTLMKTLKNKEKYVLTTQLLADPSGVKIGKTTGNAINLFGDPNDLYGQIMSLSDNMIIPAFTLSTEIPLTEIDSFKSKLSSNPMELKKRLALEIVKLCQGEEKAKIAATHFQSTIQKKELPEDIQTISVNEKSLSALQLLSQSNLEVSNSEIKRLIKQGGVEIDGQKITDPNQEVNIKTGTTIKFGKREWRKIK